jgi:hypothetical protein
LLDIEKRKNPIINKYEIDLKENSELHNDIIHDRTYPFLDVIAI